ncbi:MAG: sensor histidine kinase [Opitutus sp.]|nr:sensor histidine kinase [Opitutus sp.]
MKILSLRFAFAVALVATAGAQPPALTTAMEVRALSVAQAQQGLTARLRGTVVYIEPASVFVQDETSTAFFRPNRLGDLRPGDEIEVQGATRMGLFLPGIGSADFRILRHGPLPAGVSATYDDLVAARHHYKRVAVEGVVRSLAPIEEGRSLMRLAMGSRILEVRVDAPPDRDRVRVDSRVRVQGLAAGFINERRQLVQPHVRMIDWNDLAVVDAAPGADQVPLISAAELLAFRVSGHGERRVRIAGTVTASFPGGLVFLRHDETALAVRLDAPFALNPGDRLEISGFPEMDRFSASVVDAEIVSRTAGTPPAPIEVGTPDRLTGLHDAHLVSVTASLTDSFKSDGNTVFVLQGRTRTVQALLPESAAVPATGSQLRITGVCRVESNQPGSGFTTRPGIVSLRARSADDVTVLQSPPWWNALRLRVALSVAAGVALLAALWIIVLRLQVARQTAALRRRIESEAALEERQRIAREFHDSLEQELAGVSLRLDALATREIDEKGRHLVTASRNLVSRIQTETRDLIADLRDPNETAGDLTTALAAVAARHAADSGADVRFETAAKLPPLPAATVHDLRMIARESVNNALKHGRATCVTISLAAGEGKFALRIVDNGCGFDAATATERKRGHFGCEGIRERGRKIGADVAWHSVLQKGATVEITLPLRDVVPDQIDEAPLAHARSHEGKTAQS